MGSASTSRNWTRTGGYLEVFYTRPVIRHGKYPIHLRLTEYREDARPAQNYVTIELFVSRQLSVRNDRKSASAGNPAGKTYPRDRNARCLGICIAPSMAYGEVRRSGDRGFSAWPSSGVVTG